MDKELMVAVVVIVVFIVSMMGFSVLGSYLTNEQTIECVSIAPSETIAMACFN